MKKLLNTLFITQENAYLALKGETVVIQVDQEKIGQVPLLNLEAICTFGYAGASPALMGYCAQHNINLTFLNRNGRFLARIVGKSQGNVLLRKVQYRISDSEEDSLEIAKNMIFGKVSNQRMMLERMMRDYALRIDVVKLKETSLRLKAALKALWECHDLESLRGIEGQAASDYFKCFNELILNQEEHFTFTTRSRRPPLDMTNALLSFSYTLLASEVGSALESVGLDAYVGFLHRDRPGRMSLALDVMEELRPLIADRFVLSLINRKEITPNDFIVKENGAVLLKDASRKEFLKKWQQKKTETLTHPRLKEKITWGLVPYAQALILARHLRGDTEAYAPFLWR